MFIVHSRVNQNLNVWVSSYYVIVIITYYYFIIYTIIISDGVSPALPFACLFGMRTADRVVALHVAPTIVASPIAANPRGLDWEYFAKFLKLIK